VTPTRQQLAEFNRGVYRAREAYRQDPLALSRQIAVGHIKQLRGRGRINRAEYLQMMTEVASW
jgi:hypothetical protein